MSTAISQILTSPDDFVKFNIEVFLYGEDQLNETYVTIRATLLTDIENCSTSTLRFSILTVNKEIKEKIYDVHKWVDNTTPWNSSFSIFRNARDSMLNSAKLNILSELLCLSGARQQSAQSEVSSPTNLVKMTYVWNICNLVNVPDTQVHTISAHTFPSNNNSVQFFLKLILRTIYNSIPGYSLLLNCVMDAYITRLPLIINQTFTVRDYRNGLKANYYGPYSQLYTSKSNDSRCRGPYLYGLLNSQCFTLEYQGVYAVDTKLQ